MLKNSKLYDDLAWPEVCISHLEQQMQRGERESDDTVHRALMPMLIVQESDLRSVYRDYSHTFSREVFSDDEDEFLNHKGNRTNLEQLLSRVLQSRRCLDHCFRELAWYLMDGGEIDPMEKLLLSSAFRSAQSLLKDLQDLEAQIRDWLQLHVGNLALQESTNSMELSNLQIAESKWSKKNPHRSY